MMGQILLAIALVVAVALITYGTATRAPIISIVGMAVSRVLRQHRHTHAAEVRSCEACFQVGIMTIAGVLVTGYLLVVSQSP